MTETAFDRLREALHSHVEKLRDTGHGRLQAECPAHDDGNPSLSVARTEGKALVHCHAGCDPADVLDALGLSLRDLYDDPHGTDYRYPDGRIVHRTWDEKAQRFKKFRQSGTTTGRALYRADQLPAAVEAGHPVYVVEGEQDVHALESLGAVATCNAMGASKADRFDWSPLSGADVVLVADADEPGAKHARQVAEILDGTARSLVTVHAATGKDAADHVAAGHGVDEFRPVTIDDGSEAPLPLGEPEQPPLPVQHLGALRPIVESVATAHQVPADLPAMVALTTVSAAVGGRRSVQIRRDWHEASGLYTVAAAASSERKSPPFALLTQPLRDAEARLADTGADERARHAEQYDVVKARYEEAKRDAGKVKSDRHAPENKSPTQASDEDQGEREDNLSYFRRQLAELGEPPAAPRIVASDITPEATARVMHEQHGRLALLATEGGIFDTLAGRYSGTPNFDVLLNAYSGEPVTVDRQGAEPLRIAAANLTMGLTVQPHVLESIGRKQDAGFRGRGLLGRFLYALPASMVGRRTIDPPEVDPAALTAWADLVDTLVTHVWNGEHRVLPLDPDADAALRAYRVEHESRLGEGGDLEDLPDWGGKLPGHLVRVALVLTLASNPLASAVTGQAMADAVALSSYFEAHARHAYQLMTGGRHERLRPARAVLAWIRRHRLAEFTTREAQRGVQNQTWASDAAAVEEALEQLAEHGWIAPRDEPDTGKPRKGRPKSPRWDVSPHAHRSGQGQKGHKPAPAEGTPTSVISVPVDDSATPEQEPVSVTSVPTRDSGPAPDFTCQSPDCRKPGWPVGAGATHHPGCPEPTNEETAA